jgi:uroporphyrinogen-III synthase
MLKSNFHIVSTKVLHPALIHQMESAGLKVTQADFIRKTILISDSLPAPLHATIVLTSQTAVRAWIEIAQRIKLDLENYPVYCLASATQAMAVRQGLKISGVATDAASLADEIVKDKSISAVTFVCGDKRRDELPNRLKKNGVDVQEIIAYKTELVPVKISQPYSAVLFFSPSAVDSFLSLNKMDSSTCFCLGKTTADHARLSGFSEIHLAKTHTPESLVEKIIHYYKNQVLHAQK